MPNYLPRRLCGLPLVHPPQHSNLHDDHKCENDYRPLPVLHLRPLPLVPQCLFHCVAVSMYPQNGYFRFPHGRSGLAHG